MNIEFHLALTLLIVSIFTMTYAEVIRIITLHELSSFAWIINV